MSIYIICKVVTYDKEYGINILVACILVVT
jgi:hypothetical protein